MDVQVAFPKNGAAAVRNGDLLVIEGAVVADQHGELSLPGLLHQAGNHTAVGQGDGDGISPDRAFGFNVHGKVTVQAQKGQRPVFRHAQTHIVANLRVDFLDTAADTGGEGGGGGVILGAVNLAVKGFQLTLGVGQGAHNGGHIHLGQQFPLRHQVTGLREDLVDLHPGGHLDLLLIHLFQHPGAGDKGVNGAGFYLIGQHLFFRRGELLLHTAAQIQYQ